MTAAPDYDENDDAVILEYAWRSAEQRPRSIDPASWELVQRIQAEEAVSSRRSSLAEFKSLALAMKLQDEEDARHAGSQRQSESDEASNQDILGLHDNLSLALSMLNKDEEDTHRAWSKRQLEEVNQTSICPDESRSLAVAITLQDEEHTRLARLNQKREERRNMEFAVALQNEELETVSIERIVQAKKTGERMQLLEPCQLAALRYVQKRASEMHDAALPDLQRKAQELGFQPDDLYSCLKYIREDAPIIIHLTEQTLKYLVNDTHYRCGFETRTGMAHRNLSARQTWETGLFGGCYDNCKPCLRPKYGCLNVSGAIQGVLPARSSYGNLFITLAQHVRYSSTFSEKDTSIDPSSTLATNEYYAHILTKYPDDELRAVLSVSRFGGAPLCRCNHYKEVQIHGPVCLASDVQSLSVPGWEAHASRQLKRIVDQFQKKTRCNVFWQGDLLAP